MESTTYKVYFQFFKVIRSVDVVAFSYNDAKKVFLKKYGMKPENIIKIVDYRDIIKQKLNEYFIAKQNSPVVESSDSSEILKGNKKPLPT